MTPLGCPVVPEEYTKKARSSAGLLAFVLRYFDDPAVLMILVKCFTLYVESFWSPITITLSIGIPTFSAAACAFFMNGNCVTIARAPESLS